MWIRVRKYVSSCAYVLRMVLLVLEGDLVCRVLVEQVSRIQIPNTQHCKKPRAAPQICSHDSTAAYTAEC